MVQRLFKRAPVISTLKLDSGIAIEPEPIQSKPLNPNIIQESIESLTLSKPKPSQRTNSIWKTSSTSTVPWHAKQGSLPTVSVPQLRLDTNPDSIHFNMFRNAFGKRLEKKQDVQVVPVQSKSEEEVEFRPQRFFAKQVCYFDGRKILG
jgi:hypothetical protein